MMPPIYLPCSFHFQRNAKKQSIFTDFVKEIWSLEKLGHLEFARQSMTERGREGEREEKEMLRDLQKSLQNEVQ